MAKVNETLDNIEKRENFVMRKIDLEMANAKKLHAAGKKREALQCIKKKKMFEQQLDSLAKTKITLENQKMTMEVMNINQETLLAQKLAAEAMQDQTKKMGGVEKVEEIMDNVEDAQVSAQEIQEAISRQIDLPGLDADDDELLEELEKMTEDDIAAQMSEVKLGAISEAEMPSAPISLPAAGTKKVMTEEEKELAELEAAMAL